MMQDKRFLPQVLLIENDIPTIELYRRELAQNYRIISCHDEGTVLKHLQDNDIEAVILEPAFLGWSLLAKIKEITFSARVPIIVCTTQDAYLQPKEMGAARCLVKPVLPITLHHLLDELVRDARRDS